MACAVLVNMAPDFTTDNNFFLVFFRAIDTIVERKMCPRFKIETIAAQLGFVVKMLVTEAY